MECCISHVRENERDFCSCILYTVPQARKLRGYDLEGRGERYGLESNSTPTAADTLWTSMGRGKVDWCFNKHGAKVQRENRLVVTQKDCCSC